MSKKIKNLNIFSILIPFVTSLIIGATINHLPKDNSITMEMSIISSASLQENSDLYLSIIDHSDFQNLNRTLLNKEKKLELYCPLISISGQKMIDATFGKKSIKNENGNFLNIKYLIDLNRFNSENLNKFNSENCISHTLSIIERIFKNIVQGKINYNTSILDALELETNSIFSIQFLIKNIELNKLILPNKTLFKVVETKILNKKKITPFNAAFISFFILIFFFNFKKIYLLIKKIYKKIS